MDKGASTHLIAHHIKWSYFLLLAAVLDQVMKMTQKQIDVLPNVTLQQAPQVKQLLMTQKQIDVLPNVTLQQAPQVKQLLMGQGAK